MAAGIVVAAAVAALPSAADTSESLPDKVRSALGGVPSVTQDKNVAPPRGGATPDSKTTRQQPLLRLVEQVANAPDRTGYVDAKIDVDRLAVTFFWHGDVPTAVRELVAAEKGAGIAVEFKDVPYTLEELHAESRRILETYEPAVTAAPNDDYTGLKVGVDPAVVSVASARIESMMAIEVFERGKRERAVRYADSAPFWGGALLIDRTQTSICSAGWAVDLPDGGTGAVTAEHCFSPDGFWMAGVSDRVYGISVDDDYQSDSRLLVGPGYSPVLYTGAWDSSMGTGKQVHAWSQAVEGEYVCHGGALSGEVCNDVLVYETGVWYDYPEGVVGPGFETLKQSRIGSAGNGDSGGPTYRPRTSDGLDKAVILGMIESIDTFYEDDCQGLPAGDGRTCSLMVFSVDVNAINEALGVVPSTQ